MGLSDKLKKISLNSEERKEYKQYLEVLKELAKEGVNVSDMDNSEESKEYKPYFHALKEIPEEGVNISDKVDIKYYRKLKKCYEEYKKNNNNNNLSFIEWYKIYAPHIHFKNYCIKIANEMIPSIELFKRIKEISKMTITEFKNMLEEQNLNDLKNIANSYFENFERNNTYTFEEYRKEIKINEYIRDGIIAARKYDEIRQFYKR